MRIFTEEHRQKLRAAHLGKKLSEEHKRKLSLAGKGRKKSDETRARMRLAQKGRVMSPEARRKVSLSLIGKPGRNTGNRHTERTKEKISLANLGKPAWNKGLHPDYVQRERHHAWKGGINTTIAYRSRKRNASGTHTNRDWEELKRKYNHMCLCCKQQEPFIKLSEDHIVPLSVGGTNDISNIQPLCKECNSRKHAKTIDYSLTFSL